MNYASKQSKWLLAILLIVSVLAIIGGAFAQEDSLSASAKDAVIRDGGADFENDGSPHDRAGFFVPASNQGFGFSMSQKSGPRDPTPNRAVLDWETGEGKSYLIPALEIPAFNLALNGAARIVASDEVENGKKVYSSNLSTFWDHLIHGPWGFDQDSFLTNQFLHPYQGTIYHGIARSTGLNFWESLGYTFAGSFLWETGGETTRPSINDQVATGIGGSFFGEPLFRMAGLLLEDGGGKPGFWRELGAALLSPPLGFNRLVFGDRFKTVFPSHDPAFFHRLRVGGGVVAHVSNPDTLGPGGRYQATFDYAMSYGLPGKPNYTYNRPFDYFQFEFNVISRPKNSFENVMTRGLLLGKKYEAGESLRGVWGIFGSYDFISPQIFRVSSTAASFGTTAQWWLTRTVALQGTALAGGGYGAGGKTRGVGKRDYHYGAVGQGLLALRLIMADIAALDITGRGYYVSGLGATERHGREAIARLDAGLIVRVYGRHAVGIQYIGSLRDSRYSNIPDTRQTLGTVSLVYTLLGDTRFGAVEWRDRPKP